MQLPNFAKKIDLLSNSFKPKAKTIVNQPTISKQRVQNPATRTDQQIGNFVTCYYQPDPFPVHLPEPVHDENGYLQAERSDRTHSLNMAKKAQTQRQKSANHNAQYQKNKNNKLLSSRESHQTSVRKLMDKLDEVVKHILECGGEQSMDREKPPPQLNKDPPKHLAEIIPRLQGLREFAGRLQMDPSTKKKQLDKQDSNLSISVASAKDSLDQSYAVSEMSMLSQNTSEIYSHLLDLQSLRIKWKKSDLQILQQVRKLLVTKFLSEAQKQIAHKRRIQQQALEKDRKKRGISLKQNKVRAKIDKVDRLSKISRISKQKSNDSVNVGKQPSEQYKRREKIHAEWVKTGKFMAPGIVFQKTKQFTNLFNKEQIVKVSTIK